MDLTAANSGMGNELVDHADNDNVIRVHIDEKEENVNNNSSSSSSIIITIANQLYDYDNQIHNLQQKEEIVLLNSIT